jgi:hypothetical protein
MHNRPLSLSLVVGSLAAFACDPAPTTNDAEPTATPSAAALASGTPVVAAVTKVSFREGTVVASEAGQVTFALGPAPDGGERPTQTVPRERVWPLAVAGTALDGVTKKGGHGICKLELTGRAGALPRWYPCSITGGAAGKARVRDVYGKRHTLEPAHVVVPEGETREHIADYMAREARHRAFDKAFEEGGRPFQPPNWDPAAGDEIVVHFVETSWYGGKVVEHKRDKGKVRVSWDGGTWDDRDVPLSEVAPRPTGPLPVRAGSHALVRPDKPTKRWEPVVVVSVGDSSAEVKNRDEHERSVPRRDLLPLTPTPTP